MRILFAIVFVLIGFWLGFEAITGFNPNRNGLCLLGSISSFMVSAHLFNLFSKD